MTTFFSNLQKNRCATLSFKRFLEIGAIIDQPVAVITDNDRDYANNIEKKYKDFKDIKCVSIFADKRNDLGTLEPQFVDANKDNIVELCATINIDSSQYDTDDKIIKYMTEHKTDWALRVFESNIAMAFPQYITDTVRWCNE